MRRWVVLVAASLFAGQVTAATDDDSLTLLEGRSRFSDLARVAEARIATQSVQDTPVLAPLCTAYFHLKRFDKLTSCLDRLEERVLSGDTTIKADKFLVSDSDASPLANMLRAQAHLELGNYSGSQEQSGIALSRIREVLPFGIWPAKRYRLTILATLSLSAALNGNTEVASKHLKELEELSLGFMGSAGYPSQRDNGVARTYIALGNCSKALDYLKDESGGFVAVVRALDNASRGYAEGDSNYTSVELPRAVMRGRCLLETGRNAEAKPVLDRLLQNPRLLEYGDLYWLVLFDRGRLAELERNFDQAVDLFRRAIQVIESQRALLRSEASKIGFVGDKQAVYGRLIAVLIEQGRAAEAFDYVERSKSRALVDMLAAKKDFAAADPAQAALVLARLDAADLNARVQDDSARPEAKTTGARNLQVAKQALQSAAPELSTLVTVSSVPSDELKALVGADETLIEYYYQGKDLYAFLLDRGRLLAVRLDASELAAQVQTLRKALEATESPVWQEPARRLYLRLWQPLEKLVATRNIVVVAHGALHYLPFAALQDGEGKFLLDRYSLRFLPSASVLKYLRPVLQNKDGRLLALGNPDLGDPRLDLAFAEGEAKLVASLYPTSRVLLRKDASESNFKKAGGVFSRIHFASHGKFQADEPLKSGLYLAKDADNDGILTVGELYSMNLEADMVTLSACETGLGKIASGDDVVGLTRGFLYAGSRSIVASLWSVDDQATATLMQAFYGNLGSMNKREALRQAQIKAREAFPHPFFWAAFQLTGRAE